MITTKQRAYLRGLANGEPAILQVGKDGITPALIGNISLALDAREIVKKPSPRLWRVFRSRRQCRSSAENL